MRVHHLMVAGCVLHGTLAIAGDAESENTQQWQNQVQEQMVRINGHFEWVGSSVNDLEDSMLEVPAEQRASTPPYHLETIRAEDFDIPITVNSEVKRWMKFYIGPGRRTFETYLSRSSRFEPLIREELKNRGLPGDLMYLAMVESGFVNEAISGSGAAGIWQFMPATARMYGVRLDWWADDRRDPVRATQAAATLLADLYRMHGSDWYLAWAAYNGGPRRVKDARKSAGSSDFWKISRKGLLPSETSNYVPKVIAMAILSKYRERFGFTEIRYLPALALDHVDLGGGVEVVKLAHCAGLSEPEFRKLNPGLKRSATPSEGYSIRLPKGMKDSFLAAVEKLSMDTSGPKQFVRHKVRKGQFLGSIARKYGVAQSEIIRVNKITNANRIGIGDVLVIPIPGAPPPREEVEALVAKPSAPQKATSKREATVKKAEEPVKSIESKEPVTKWTHLVKTGETLWNLSAKYGVSISQIQRWNSLSGSRIQAGKVLQLRAPDSERIASTQYKVQEGDNLSSVALRYGVSVAQLQNWNKISKASSIQAGQVLNVMLEAAGWRDYMVRDGDNLGEIALKHTCTVEDIRVWNGLKGTMIRPGQRLRIRD